jgi:predicted RNase H-like nuclease (RuvC/YqgF family)
MKSSPIKALSDLLGKIVIEHGSAVIQEKQISLLKEQFSILEREHSKLLANKTELQSKNQVLETENEALKREIMQLEKRIQSDAQPLDNNLLHEIEIKVLLYLSSNSGRNTKQISKALNIKEEIVKFHAGELKTKSMITSGHDPTDDYIWSLDQAGRRSLIENNLIEHESIS